MKKLTYALIGALALAGITLVSRTVSAMPVAGLTSAIEEQSADRQDVRWWGCWRCHRFGYWHRPVYAYWHRPVYAYWRRPVLWGWHRPFWRRRFWY